MSTTDLRSATPSPSPSLDAPVDSSDGKVPFPARDDSLVHEIRAQLSERLADRKEANPRTAVEALLREYVVSRRYDLLVQAAREGLIQFAWDYMKKNVINDPQAIRHKPGSGKWDDATEAMREHRDIFEATIWTSTGRKFLGDCTKADLIFAAEAREQHASTLLDNADRLKKLARKLKAGQVVSDLERAVVAGVFDA